MTTKRTPTGTDHTLIVKYDTHNAQGTVVIEQGVHGQYITIPEVVENNPIVLVDLYHRSQMGEGSPFYPAGTVIITCYDPDNVDREIHVVYEPDKPPYTREYN